jgi:hypothetical protein
VIGCLVPGCPCPHSATGEHGRGQKDPHEVRIVLDRAQEPGIGSGLGTAEKLEVAAVLSAAGWSAHKIGLALGVTERTICRWRTAIRRSKESTS